MSETERRVWIRTDLPDLDVGRVTTVVVGDRAVAVTRTEDGWGALDNHCPHQGGPLGDGQIEDGYLICPWHAYEYHPCTGQPPSGFSDAATARMVGKRRLPFLYSLSASTMYCAFCPLIMGTA